VARHCLALFRQDGICVAADRGSKRESCSGLVRSEPRVWELAGLPKLLQDSLPNVRECAGMSLELPDPWPVGPPTTGQSNGSALRMSCLPSVRLTRMATWPVALTDTGFDARSATLRDGS
jgi:hypothetical protein